MFLYCVTLVYIAVLSRHFDTDCFVIAEYCKLLSMLRFFMSLACFQLIEMFTK